MQTHKCHKLAIERQRYVGKHRNDRICKFCYDKRKINCVEDEIHFLLVCPLYDNLRVKYLQKYCCQDHELLGAFIKIMISKNQQCIRDLAAYIYHATQIQINYADM